MITLGLQAFSVCTVKMDKGHSFSGFSSTHSIVLLRLWFKLSLHPCCIFSHHINRGHFKIQRDVYYFMLNSRARYPPYFSEEPRNNIQILIFGVDYHSNKHKFGSALTIAWDDPTDNCFHPTFNCFEKTWAFISRLEQALNVFCRYVKYTVSTNSSGLSVT